MTSSTERVRAMRARKVGRVEVLLEPDDLRTIEAIRATLEGLGQPSEVPVSSLMLRGLHAYLRSLNVPQVSR